MPFSSSPFLELRLPMEFFTMLKRLHIIKTNKEFFPKFWKK